MEGFALNDTGIVALNFLGGIYSALLYIVPSYFFALIAIIMTIDFLHLRHDLQRGIGDDGVVCVKSLEWFRMRHNSLCILVELADDIFAGWIALTLGAGVMQVLAGIFLMVANSRGYTNVAELTQAFWLITYFLQVAIVLYRGAVVNAAVIACQVLGIYSYVAEIFSPDKVPNNSATRPTGK